MTHCLCLSPSWPEPPPLREPPPPPPCALSCSRRAFRICRLLYENLNLTAQYQRAKKKGGISNTLTCSSSDSSISKSCPFVLYGFKSLHSRHRAVRGLFSAGNLSLVICSAALWRGSFTARDPYTGQMYLCGRFYSSYNSYNIGSYGTSLEGGNSCREHLRYHTINDIQWGSGNTNHR